MQEVAIDAPPDPVALAARVAPLGDVAVLWTATGDGLSYVAAGASARSRALAPAGVAEAGPVVPRWIGLLPYEAARGLERRSWTAEERRAAPHHVEPVWRRYDAVLRVDPVEGRVVAVGCEAAQVAELARLASRDAPVGSALVDGFTTDAPEAHRARVERALAYIREGQAYQLCVARRFEGRVRGAPLAVLGRLGRAFPTRYAFYCDFYGEHTVLSTSPELFLRIEDQTIITRPIKGTRARGRDALDDESARRLLDADPKERAELAMIVDLERSDLGRVARTGTVRVSRPPQIETHATLHHRVAEVSATLRAGVSLEEVVRAAWPSGSVTGAPKVRAMELIAELEAARRGLYTGALGAVMSDGSVTLAMAIRTLTVADGAAHYHAGGGIVEASDPAREEQETRLKAAHLAALAAG